MLKQLENGQAYQLKERIKAKARDDKKIKLDACWNLLVNLHSSGEIDFSVSKVGKALEHHGIQKAQSYRNATGKDYRDIVEAFAAEVGAKTTHQRSVSATPLEQIINNMSDLDSQIRLRMMMAELSRLKEENQSLRHEMGKMQRVPYGAKSNTDLAINQQPEPLRLGVSEKQIKKPYVGALERFIDSEWLEGHGLKVMADGTVTHDDEEITLPGFAKQLKDVVEYLSSD